MARLPNPIVPDNFPASWQNVDAQRRIAKKKYVTTRVASFFSNMAFAFLTLIVSNGLIYDHLEGSYCNYLKKIPYFLSVWDRIKALILKPGWSVALQIAVPTIVLYAVTFLICGIFVLLVNWIYHPRKQKLPDGNKKENAGQLLEMARDARRYSRKSGANGSMFWALIFMMLQFCVLALYILIELKTVDVLLSILTDPVMKLIDPYITGFSELQRGSLQGSMLTPALMLFSLGMYLAYALINHVHALSVQFMYRYNIPYSFVADVEYYHTFVDEDTAGMTEEEITAKRRESAQAKRNEGLEMEKLGAYGRAKELLSQAAHAGDAEAMAHYARHWLIAQAKDPAKYWLKKCVDTGEANEYAVRTLRRLKWRLRVRAQYLK